MNVDGILFIGRRLLNSIIEALWEKEREANSISFRAIDTFAAGVTLTTLVPSEAET